MNTTTNFSPDDMSEADAAALFPASRIAMVVTNPRLDDNPIVYVNRAFQELTGYTSEAAVGRNCRFLQGESTAAADRKAIAEAVAAGEDMSLVISNHRADGEPFLNALMISPVYDVDKKEIIYFVGLQSAVKKDYAAENLKKMESIVAEIQHRVKNHLAMILGLIRLKARETGSDVSDMTDLSRRIESLQLLYEEMSASKAQRNDDKIQLGSYLGRVANAIAHLDGRAGIRMNVLVEPLMVETESAVRIGLIMSEVITNAMQHAFDEQTSGLVELRVTRTDQGGMRAIVSDDGIGLPEGLIWPDDEGLGGRIVGGLVESLGATLNVTQGAVGTIVTLDVPSAD